MQQIIPIIDNVDLEIHRATIRSKHHSIIECSHWRIKLAIFRPQIPKYPLNFKCGNVLSTSRNVLNNEAVGCINLPVGWVILH